MIEDLIVVYPGSLNGKKCRVDVACEGSPGVEDHVFHLNDIVGTTAFDTFLPTGFRNHVTTRR